MYSKCFNINLLLLIYFYVISFNNLVLADEQLGHYIGCYKERSVAARLMNHDYKQFKETLTPTVCMQYCKLKGFPYAGVQYSFECFCSNDRPPFRYSVEEEQCSNGCSGDVTLKCGASFRLNVYELDELANNSVAENYIGCAVDISQYRLLDAKSFTFNEKLTPEKCVAFCYRNGYRFAGLQISECFCGDALKQTSLTNEEECNVQCKNKNYICGGKARSSIYSTGITGHSENDHLLGCYKDSEKARILSGFLMNFRENNSPKLCFNVCYESGFKYAGVQYGYECYCGNLKPKEGDRAPESDCGLPCPGDRSKGCGGAFRMQIYATQEKPVRRKRATSNCIESVTEINHRKVCRDDVIFEENFDGKVSTDNWTYEIKMPWTPDYEFVVLNNKPANVYVKDGKLFIKPKLLDDDFVLQGHLKLDRCTGVPYTEECDRQATGFNIIPPIESGKITTKETFSFKYGKIQIRAKLPKGDWIVPEIWLEPKRKMYGPSFASGRIRIAMARGNQHLLGDSKECGNTKLESGVIVGIKDNVRARTVITDNPEGWYKNFHNYTFIWTPDNLKFSVDGGTVESLVSPGKTLLDVMGFDDNGAYRWITGSTIAPFDQEFYISIGLSVGGMREFPDGSISGNNPKPWKNMAVKAMLNFWLDRDNWFKTWVDDTNSLQIEHIQVTAM